MPFPKFKGAGSALGGLASIFGAGLEGYAKDQETRVQRARVQQADLREAQRLAQDTESHKAQLESTRLAQDLTKSKLAGNQKAWKTLVANHGWTGDYDDNVIYGDELKSAKTAADDQKKFVVTQRAYRKELQNEFGNDPIARKILAAPFDETNPGRYDEALKDARMRRQIALQKPTSEPSLWVKDTTNNQDVYVTRTQLLSAPAGKYTRPASSAGGTALQTSSMAAAKVNLQSAKKYMDEYEAKLARGEGSYTPYEATQAALSSGKNTQTTEGITGAIGSWFGNKAAASLSQNNPELAQYLRARKFVAEAILNTHRRPNQTQYDIEQELAGVSPRDSGWDTPEAQSQITQSADRRTRMFNEVFGGEEEGTAPPAPAAPAGTPLFPSPGAATPAAPASPQPFKNAMAPRAAAPAPIAPAVPAAIDSTPLEKRIGTAMQAAQSVDRTLTANPDANRPPLEARIAQLKAGKVNKAVAKAILRREGYTLPQ